ncbi:hypothetical protein BDZ89DRAFT_83505 [Hymenopellis radicata]|nr:hypothetical protein BDZ89DRAFT_83505 [Hymenopellis radicata]
MTCLPTTRSKHLLATFPTCYSTGRPAQEKRRVQGVEKLQPRPKQFSYRNNTEVRWRPVEDLRCLETARPEDGDTGYSPNPAMRSSDSKVHLILITSHSTCLPSRHNKRSRFFITGRPGEIHEQHEHYPLHQSSHRTYQKSMSLKKRHIDLFFCTSVS